MVRPVGFACWDHRCHRGGGKSQHGSRVLYWQPPDTWSCHLLGERDSHQRPPFTIHLTAATHVLRESSHNADSSADCRARHPPCLSAIAPSRTCVGHRVLWNHVDRTGLRDLALRGTTAWWFTCLCLPKCSHSCGSDLCVVLSSRADHTSSNWWWPDSFRRPVFHAERQADLSRSGEEK